MTRTGSLDCSPTLKSLDGPSEHKTATAARWHESVIYRVAAVQAAAPSAARISGRLREFVSRSKVGTQPELQRRVGERNIPCQVERPFQRLSQEKPTHICWFSAYEDEMLPFVGVMNSTRFFLGGRRKKRC